jgi:hypothetical protein
MIDMTWQKKLQPMTDLEREAVADLLTSAGQIRGREAWERGGRGELMFKKEQLSDNVVLFQGDCREIIPTLGRIDAVISPIRHLGSTPSSRAMVARINALLADGMTGIGEAIKQPVAFWEL